jgi:hypothetical protein
MRIAKSTFVHGVFDVILIHTGFDKKYDQRTAVVFHRVGKDDGYGLPPFEGRQAEDRVTAKTPDP